MTVECGRARFGASSVLRATLFGVFAAIGLFASGCGSTTLTYGTPVITFSVTPGPYKAYLIELEGITLTRTDGTVTNLFGTNNVTTVERFDPARSTYVDELFGAPAVLTGTYTTATVTFNYSTSQIALESNGQIGFPTILDTTGAAVSTITYTIDIDPANPLVITQGALTRVNLNFDFNAGTALGPTPAGQPAAYVRPYLTLSTNPVYTKPMRARGVSVTVDAAAGTYTMNARPFYDDASNPFGAITVQTTAQTTYNVNGINYTGAAGLAAVGALPVNTTLAAYGSLSSATSGTGTSTSPVFDATEVIAGTSLENLAADRVIGTVAERTPTSLLVHGAEIITRPGEIVSDVATTQLIEYVQDLTVPIDDSTLVVVDGQPNTTATTQSISIGQEVDINGQALDANGVAIGTSGLPIATINATGELGGIVRLTSTAAWGTLNQAPQNGQLALDLTNLGGYEPGAYIFTGTGSATGADSNLADYRVTATGLDTGTLTTGSQVLVNGIVPPFGTAPPDFTASAVTPASSTPQVLVIDYVNGGTTIDNGFLTADSNGLLVNMANANLGETHEILTGPFITVLTSPLPNIRIVPAASANFFAVGDPAINATIGIGVFNTYSGLLSALGGARHGAIEKIVAVGQFDGDQTFTATSINIVNWF
jgi:hypothetical protein